MSLVTSIVLGFALAGFSGQETSAASDQSPETEVEATEPAQSASEPVESPEAGAGEEADVLGGNYECNVLDPEDLPPDICTGSD